MPSAGHDGPKAKSAVCDAAWATEDGPASNVGNVSSMDWAGHTLGMYCSTYLQGNKGYLAYRLMPSRINVTRTTSEGRSIRELRVTTGQWAGARRPIRIGKCRWVRTCRLDNDDGEVRWHPSEIGTQAFHRLHMSVQAYAHRGQSQNMCKRTAESIAPSKRGEGD